MFNKRADSFCLLFYSHEKTQEVKLAETQIANI